MLFASCLEWTGDDQYGLKYRHGLLFRVTKERGILSAHATRLFLKFLKASLAEWYSFYPLDRGEPSDMLLEHFNPKIAHSSQNVCLARASENTLNE